MPKKTIKNASPEKYFVLVTGVPLKNLKELANAFETMNDWVFDHHVNGSRNDFADWVKNVLKEPELAKDLKLTKNIKEMELTIFRYITNKYL